MGIGKEQIMITETSERGRDFNDLPLNDENIACGAALFFRDKHYTAGNRGHGLVELFTGFKRIKTVPYSEVSLVREKSKNKDAKTVEVKLGDLVILAREKLFSQPRSIEDIHEINLLGYKFYFQHGFKVYNGDVWVTKEVRNKEGELVWNFESEETF